LSAILRPGFNNDIKDGVYDSRPTKRVPIVTAFVKKREKK